MEKHNEINESEGAPTCEKELAGIEERLGRIEQLLQKTQSHSQFQWAWSTGFAVIGAGLALIGVGGIGTGGGGPAFLILWGMIGLVLGLVIILISLRGLGLFKKKPGRKSQEGL